ncbi:siderophore-interacting protein [Amycolatopsis sp. NBC_01307]|uniref:siderophore-interacting protein n=1 Tax=Amycolatopsis sp. NBC_01307 TaxID=2903561 RepID=UPI002E101BD9|nr:siderophore-interacting protein [Amycolatopsis sp. NBC_01307]
MTALERLADLAGGMVLDTARVTAVTRLPSDFVRVELAADAFRKATWVPGAKLQFRPRRGTLSLRTYTPIGWDVERGVTELLGFTHGDGPAARWLRQVAVGDACEVFGPRRSIDLRATAGPVVFVGDESSVALACALRTVTAEVSHVFEARDPAGLTEVLAGLDLDAQVVGKTADRAELLSRARAAGPGSLVVTGDAATVHAIRRDSRTWPHPPRAVTGKAYWAEGRAGLD